MTILAIILVLELYGCMVGLFVIMLLLVTLLGEKE